MKRIRSYIIALAFICVCACPMILFSGCGPNVAKVTFNGFDGVQELVSGKDDSKAEIPTYTFEDKTLVGWATSSGATTAQILVAQGSQYQDTVITYETVKDYLDKNNAVTLYEVYQSKVISLTFNGFSGTTSLDSITQNTATEPTVSVEANQEFLGWTSIQDGEEVQIMSGSTFNYATLKLFAPSGSVTLYPVIQTYDLVVAIWAVNGTSNIYVTQEQLEAMSTDFATYLTGISNNAKVKYYMVSGSSDSEKSTYYPTQIPEKSMVILGGANVVSQCNGYIAVEENSYLVLNYDYCNYPEKSTAKRYATIVTEYKDNELAKLFVDFLCGTKIQITFEVDGDPVLASVSNILENVVNAPVVTPAQGETFFGWARSSDAMSADIDVNTPINYNAVKDLASEGKITLYPVCLNSQNISVTFVGCGDDPIVLNNISANVAEPEFTQALETGKELKGWSTTENPTVELLQTSPETTFGAKLDLNYANLVNFATEGNLTLYPIIGDHYDLVVSVHTNNGGKSTWFNDTKFNNIQDGFMAYLQSQSVDVANININWIEIKGVLATPSDEAITATYSNYQVDSIEVAVGRYIGTGYNSQTYASDYTPEPVLAVTPDKDAGDVKAGILDGKETNPLAVHFYNYITTAPAE